MSGVAVLRKTGLELADALQGGTPSDLIVVDSDVLTVLPDCNWYNLIVEPALLLSMLCTTVGLNGIFVLLVAGDVEVASYVLRCGA